VQIVQKKEVLNRTEGKAEAEEEEETVETNTITNSKNKRCIMLPVCFLITLCFSYRRLYLHYLSHTFSPYFSPLPPFLPPPSHTPSLPPPNSSLKTHSLSFRHLPLSR